MKLEGHAEYLVVCLALVLLCAPTRKQTNVLDFTILHFHPHFGINIIWQNTPVKQPPIQ